jgi:DNA-3-methyladenine glycosylase
MIHPSDPAPLDRSFFARPTLEVARALLGCVLVSARAEGRTSGRIVETEGYLGPADPASHAARLTRGRVTAMWGPPGFAYLYRSYGIHAMLNVVTEPEGSTGAVLIRALEPLTGIDLMRRRRGVDTVRLLCAGPGRLCQAMGITLGHHGLDLVAGRVLWLEPGPAPESVVVGPRIGVSRGADQPWRFFEAGSGYVSAHRRGLPAVP